MKEPLDETYFVWLYSQVGDPRIKGLHRTYWKVLKKLFTKEFVWIVPNDDNRVEDGRELRYEFVHDEGLNDVDPDWLHLGCSMLELLVGLSRRLAFVAEGEPSGWFWHLMENIGLGGYTDERLNPRAMRYTELEVDEILERIIYRTYHPSGDGGLFPLKNTPNDQRHIELWYQMSEYVLERV